MNQPKISVIVPVCKTEPYLRKCIESITNQTYRNLEIILVNDGSPDNCGAICDGYGNRDSRIIVIHKGNGGVSSARNAGLSVASGEWIGWVDSDDWVEPDMYEYLLEHAAEEGADIAVCGRYEEYKTHRVFRGWDQAALLDTETALEELLKNDRMQNFLWDKLCRRQIYRGIVFPEGRTYEDIAVMHRLFERAERIACLPEGKYHYLQRAGSIVDDVSLANRINHYIAAEERYRALAERWPQFRPLLEGQCVASAVGIWCAYYRNSRSERSGYGKELREIARFSRGHYPSALKYLGLGAAGRIVVPLTAHAVWWAFAMARLYGWAYRKKHGREL